MISFIIIGRNEGWKLSLSILSILNIVKDHTIDNFEIIYVDSNSSDDSIEIVKKFNKVKIYKLTGDFNAAIARNIGVEKSLGDVLFFIDGDMELKKEAFSLVYSKEKGLFRDYISGNWLNYFYDTNNTLLDKEPFSKQESDTLETTTGGLFALKRQTWDLAGGMRPMYKKSQDVDLGLRLANNGILLLRKKEILANHHTIRYRSKSRIWKELFNGKHLYGRSLIYRNHLLNKHVYSRFFRNEYSLIILIICLALLFFKGGYYSFLFYFISILFRSKFKPIIFLYFMIRDVMVLFGFLFFHPKKKYNTKVEEILV